MTKKLKDILLVSTFLFGLIASVFSEGVSELSEKYLLDSYTVTFGDEIITFEERISPPTERNEVANPNIKDYHIIVKEPGKTIRYMDLYGGDFKLDAINITRNGASKYYNKKSSAQNAFIVEEAQKRFDFYLELIRRAKVKDILGN